jgi:hypothetical protein
MVLSEIPVLPKLDTVKYSKDIVKSYSVPLRFLNHVDCDTLTKALEYNPYNINDVFSNKHISDTTIHDTLSVLVQYLEYANSGTRIKLESLSVENEISLPILVKPADR